ncbi:MAG TPA: (2Fe-2S)-binding protein [Symbiobacteriaceae bacterium]|nr:(2Fe-2S)-binding protein [Symbiobacteriaceae bacterium]
MKDEDMIICRCEEVTLHQLQEAIARGATTSRQLKLETRAGMGFCQGRTCRSLVERIVGAEPAPDEDGSSTLAYRPPARPITFGHLAGEGSK